MEKKIIEKKFCFTFKDSFVSRESLKLKFRVKLLIKKNHLIINDLFLIMIIIVKLSFYKNNYKL